MTEGPFTSASSLLPPADLRADAPSRLDRAMRALDEAIDNRGERVQAVGPMLAPLLKDAEPEAEVAQATAREVSGTLKNMIYNQTERIERLGHILGGVLSRLDV